MAACQKVSCLGAEWCEEWQSCENDPSMPQRAVSQIWISSKKVSTYLEELAPQLSLSWIVALTGRFHNFATPNTTLLLGTTPSDKPPWCTQLLARRIIGASSAVQYTVYSIYGRSRQNLSIYGLSRQNLVYTCRTGTQTGLTRLQTSYNRPVAGGKRFILPRAGYFFTYCRTVIRYCSSFHPSHKTISDNHVTWSRSLWYYQMSV